MPGRRITLTFRHQQAQTYRVDLRTAEGRDYTGTFTLPYDAPTWAAIMQALEPGFDPAQAPEEVRAALAPLGDLDALRVTVGNALGQALFTDDALIEGLLGPLGNAAGERSLLPVTLRFGHETDLLAALPWELLRHRDRFLVADGSLGLTRCPTSVEPPTPAHADLPLRVLLVLAEPLDAPPIFAHGARRELRHGLRTLDQEGAVIVDALEPPTFDTLVEAVTNGDYHLVVFYGHGAYDPNDGGLLLFEDPFGGQDAVPAVKVGAVLHNTSVRMALLSACQSGQMGAERGVWSGTAPALLRAGVPLVVGMQTRLRVDAAQAFIRQFALSLAQAKPIAAAVGEARKPLLHGDGEQWFVPVLYGRPADSDRLFDPDAALPPETADLRAHLRELRAKIADLEQTVSRVGTSYRPEELAALRAARRDFSETRTQLARKTPGGYTQVVSPLYGVPENPIFVGRSAEMRAVGQRLATGDPVVIWGTGGIGKTALAAEVARRQRWRFPGGVLWLDCSGSPALDTLLNRLGAFAGLAVEQIEPDRKPTAVRQALALLDDRYLVVFDNAEDVWDDREVRQLIDRLPDNGQVLLTTRHHPRKSMWRMMEVKRMADSFMTMLFYRQAEADSLQIRGKRNMEAIPKIIKWMQGHPKALELTEKLLTSFPAAKIWADLQRHPVKGFSAVFATSIKHLTELQRMLFTRLSVFIIPFEWDAAYAVLPDAEEVALDDALDVLVQRALVTFDGARYAYHALVRQYAYERLQERDADPRDVHRWAAEYLHDKLTNEERNSTPEEALEEVKQWERAETWETLARRASALFDNLGRLGYWADGDLTELKATFSKTLDVLRSVQEALLPVQLPDLQQDVTLLSSHDVAVLSIQAEATLEALRTTKPLEGLAKIQEIIRRQGSDASLKAVQAYFQKEAEKILEELKRLAENDIEAGNFTAALDKLRQIRQLAPEDEETGRRYAELCRRRQFEEKLREIERDAQDKLDGNSPREALLALRRGLNQFLEPDVDVPTRVREILSELLALSDRDEGLALAYQEPWETAQKLMTDLTQLDSDSWIVNRAIALTDQWIELARDAALVGGVRSAMQLGHLVEAYQAAATYLHRHSQEEFAIQQLVEREEALITQIKRSANKRVRWAQEALQRGDSDKALENLKAVEDEFYAPVEEGFAGLLDKDDEVQAVRDKARDLQRRAAGLQDLTEKVASRIETAREAYLNGKWDAAEQVLRELPALDAEDATVLSAEVETLRTQIAEARETALRTRLQTVLGRIETGLHLAQTAEELTGYVQELENLQETFNVQTLRAEERWRYFDLLSTAQETRAAMVEGATWEAQLEAHLAEQNYEDALEDVDKALKLVRTGAKRVKLETQRREIEREAQAAREQMLLLEQGQELLVEEKYAAARQQLLKARRLGLEVTELLDAARAGALLQSARQLWKESEDAERALLDLEELSRFAKDNLHAEDILNTAHRLRRRIESAQLGSPHQRTAANALIQAFDGDVDAANAYLAQVAEAMQETDESSKP